MKRAWLGVLLISACVDLSEPRAYRCESSRDCVEPWVCLRDGFCHDPEVGVAVDCESSADCTADWFCGKDTRCHDPAKPSALACDDGAQCPRDWFCGQDGVCRDRAVPGPFSCAVDEHCAGGWRCSSEGRCIDFSMEVSAPELPFSVTSVERKSPLIPSASQLHASPTSSLLVDAGVLLVQKAVLQLSDGGVLIETFARVQQGNQLSMFSSLDALPWSGGIADIETIGQWTLVLDDAQQLWLVTDTAVQLDAGVSVRDVVPFAWTRPDASVGNAFGLVVNGAAPRVFFPTDSTILDVGKGEVVDFAFVDETAGAMRFIVAAHSSVGVGTVELWSTTPLSDEVLFTSMAGDGMPRRVWSEGKGVGALYEFSEGIQATYGARRFDIDGMGNLPPDRVLTCPGVVSVADVSVAQPESIELVCRQGETTYVWQAETRNAPLQALREYDSVVSAGTSNGRVRQSSDGVLRFGEGLDIDFPTVLDGRPEAIGTLFGGALSALRERGLYTTSDAGSVKQGLTLAQLSLTDDVVRVVGFVDDSHAALLNIGAAIEQGSGLNPDTFPWLFAGPPVLRNPRSAVVQTAEGSVLVSADGDTLWAGAAVDGGTGIVRPAVKPSPGFGVTSWVAHAADGGLIEGWATANNRLFRLTASAVDRWKVSEFAVSGRDPLTVFYAGDAARLGTASGEVLALPSRVPVAPALEDTATSLEGVCGTVVATTDEGAFQLINADGGASWVAIEAAAKLRRPIVHRAARRLFLSSETGVILELAVSCP